MRRRDLVETLTAGAALSAASAASPWQSPPAAPAASRPWPETAPYRNNRAPLLPTAYVKLPLGACRPAGWLHDQLRVQANGLTGHLHELWDIAKVSSWIGDSGQNVEPECCTPRFVPRWLEGVIALSGVLGDKDLRALADRYMHYLLGITDPAKVAPSLTAWSHLGRALPEYYELSGDPRAIKLGRTLLDYAASVCESPNRKANVPSRLGMVLAYAWWYFNQTGDPDIPALVERCTKACVDNWKRYYTTFPTDPKYFLRFPDVSARKGPDHHPSQWTRHVVDVTQAVHYPVLYYLMSKDPRDRDSVIEGMRNLDQAYGQVGARWNGDEWMFSDDPTQGTELCAIEELLFSLEKNFEALGELGFADRIEQLMFNGFPGTCTADMWAHQYDQQANQVLVSVARRPWHLNIDSSNIFGFTPNFPCCLSNMHSPWPRYVEHMWMATADRGLIAALYGPCRLQAKVGAGESVEIIEETGYPFSDQVRITLRPKQAVAFPLYLRVPSWAVNAEVVAPDGVTHRPAPGTLLKLDRLWKPGDQVALRFHFQVRVETRRRNNAAAVAWGPLYFSLRIGQAFVKLPAIPVKPLKGNIPAPPGCVDWRIAPTTDWNYALAIDRTRPEFTIVTNPVSPMPFARKGEPVKLPGAADFTPWPHDVPIILKCKAHHLPDWGMNGANAAPVPVSPVKTDSPETTVELIPYGCTRLRVSEFPTT